MKNNVMITVFGSSQPKPGSPQYEEARKVGRAIAEAGWTVVSGGYRGVMEAASLGASEVGGRTVGVTTAHFNPKGLKANPYIKEEIQARTYPDRLMKLTEMADGYVVLRGGSGTLNELFLAWELVKNGSLPLRPIILFGEHGERIINSFYRGTFRRAVILLISSPAPYHLGCGRDGGSAASGHCVTMPGRSRRIMLA